MDHVMEVLDVMDSHCYLVLNHFLLSSLKNRPDSIHRHLVLCRFSRAVNLKWHLLPKYFLTASELGLRKSEPYSLKVLSYPSERIPQWEKPE